jgi:superfamily II DNA or RNA helicase
MKLRKDLLQGIERFLALVPAQTRRRGREYFATGKVLEFKCVEPDYLYMAIVRGGADYEVGLEFADRVWVSKCSCPMQYDCKHTVAAILELQRRALPDAPPPEAANSKAAARYGEMVHPTPASSSPLSQRLSKHLGREFSPAETEFIRNVQLLYAYASYRPLLEKDLGLIIRPPAGNHERVPLELWRDCPADDYYFWLHIAWELGRRKWSYPKFMDGITDLNLIKAGMDLWKHEDEVAHWNNRFRLINARVPATDGNPLELRLVVRKDVAHLEWRTERNAEFVEFKETHAIKFGEDFERGTLEISPESLLLWSTVFKPWHYESWWNFKYSEAAARLALNRLLRLPLAADRVITPDGQALVRVSEPLRLQLRPPAATGGNYELSLATADGSPPPRIQCTFAGQPTLYLTERSLFQGPPADAFETDCRISIPAPALETAAGVRFLRTAGVPLPVALAQRVREVPVKVTLACELVEALSKTEAEDIIIRVLAKAVGMTTEKFTPHGWQPQTDGGAEPVHTPENNVIEVHELAIQGHFPRVLEPLNVKWAEDLGEWKLRVTKKTPELFVAWLKSLPPEIEVWLDPELSSLRNDPVSGSVSLDINESGLDWFDLKVVLKVGDTTLTPAELKLLLNARGDYVRLGRKGWRRLDFNLLPEEDEQLARLGLNARDFSAEPQRLHALQLADPAAKKFLAPAQVRNIQRRVSELKARVTPALPAAIRAELRPYQIEGFHFLAYLTANRFGGVLADDMGLGKTLQTLTWLAWLKLEGQADGIAKAQLPNLVVGPKSVTDVWRAEAERFYPDLRVRVWRGEPAEELTTARENADLIVINYSQLRSLSPAIADVHWRAAILDEAQSIKNPDSQTAQAARALTAEYRLALTGTPIENRLLDLWSIMAFAMPGALGNRAHFVRQYNTQDDPLARRRLAARVRPFLLRRTKMQVAKDLPDRVEEDLLCEMEGEQQTLYRAELKHARQIILGLKTNQQLNAERFNLLTSLLRLRQICCHPALVDEKLRSAESAKLTALEELLEPLMEEGHKVLVFSQFVIMLNILRDTVKQREWPHYYLSGDTENRGELVKEFQAAKGGAVFLISLKAGGMGLNLTAASYVVLFDPWWNPAVENQAIDRTHRIGQTSKVMAYRLLIRDSIEQKIRTMQKQKGALAADVLGEERFAQSLTLADLQVLFAE